ncbi:molybdenum cofactor synthesis 3 [Moniliophthora roreri]|uniref:Rhodanese domain-containing protein n=1 Tax=Moniliophthora roreri TaxID=221103 RepID=A0A0W0FKB5_MONRR|nr:molybdenum cofactor synthesis 3 [Moniliophthora roreri]
MNNPLPLADYRRYGRQMILDGFGLEGQLGLRNASVVVIGAGGLGCPALQYLGASGVGRIGIIDHDVVELSNLQRQILHSEDTLGLPKAESASIALKRMNASLNIDTIIEALTPQNAEALLASYDVILDCTDNAPTRYLLSDAAVALGKPLVSGAAQKFEGQLCVYNLGERGPCYRCLFPKPPASENVGTCEETGILGVVTGIVGNLQALEAIKIITGLHDGTPSLLIFSALGIPPFRSIKLRARKPSCLACGEHKQVIQETDYIQFCGGATPNWEQRGLVDSDSGLRISALEALVDDPKVMLIDVRPRTEFDICHLPQSRHVPLSHIVASPSEYAASEPDTQIFFICRLGNDSQIAAEALRGVKPDIVVKDVIGGLRAWSRDIDPSFPVY